MPKNLMKLNMDFPLSQLGLGIFVGTLDQEYGFVDTTRSNPVRTVGGSVMTPRRGMSERRTNKAKISPKTMTFYVALSTSGKTFTVAAARKIGRRHFGFTPKAVGQRLKALQNTGHLKVVNGNGHRQNHVLAVA